MFGEQKLLVGVIHLPPLPGYPESPGMDAVVDKALADLRALEIRACFRWSLTLFSVDWIRSEEEDEDEYEYAP